MFFLLPRKQYHPMVFLTQRKVHFPLSGPAEYSPLDTSQIHHINLLICLKSHMKNSFILSDTAFASSPSLFKAPSETVSLFSRKPVECSVSTSGSVALLHNKILSSHSKTQPDTIFDFDNEYDHTL